MKRILAALLAAALVIALALGAGCGRTGPAEEKEQPSGKDGLKIALVLPGSISDKGFNEAAYEGLKEVEKELGATTAFSEKTPVADFERAYRDFADQGYQVIVGQGFEFGDIAKKVAPDYPNVKFIVTSGFAEGPNIASLVPKSYDAAYLAGVAAGLTTKTGKVGGIAGFAFPVIVQQMEAFKAGVKAVKPGAEVNLVYIGSFEDVAKAKEAALAQIGSGADVIYHIADAAGLGVIEAAKERGVWVIGWGKDQSPLAPGNVLVSQLVDYKKMLVMELKDINDGKFSPGIRYFGLDTGVIGLVGFNPALPRETLDRVDEVRQDILSGKIKVPVINEPSK